jgi:hypothetical protein
VSEVEYPFHDRTITVTQCGRICIGRRKINLSGVFAGQNIGITEVSEKIWLVSFMQYDLGFFDHESGLGGWLTSISIASSVRAFCSSLRIK